MKKVKTRNLETTPREDGFRMPAEFEPHEKTWMLWPHRPDNWRQDAGPAQEVFAEVAAAISRFEPVAMGVSAQAVPQARKILPPEVEIVEMASDDAWMRDVGPTFVSNDKGVVRGIDWQFNAWGGLNGGLYYPWDQDAQVAASVLAHEQKERYPARFVLEGGAIHTDGQGTLITTEECLLNPNRNPELTREEIETRLKEYLNVSTVIWLGKGVYMDETDGHVDNLCCFIKPGEVLLHWTEDPSDPQYDISHQAFERLSRARDAKGRSLIVHKMPQPGPLYMTKAESLSICQSPHAAPRREGTRLAGSYVNFYMANNAIILPLFEDPQDRAAVKIIQTLFSDRTVVGINAREILLGGGNIHCITQQQPRAGF